MVDISLWAALFLQPLNFDVFIFIHLIKSTRKNVSPPPPLLLPYLLFSSSPCMGMRNIENRTVYMLTSALWPDPERIFWFSFEFSFDHWLFMKVLMSFHIIVNFWNVFVTCFLFHCAVLREWPRASYLSGTGLRRTDTRLLLSEISCSCLLWLTVLCIWCVVLCL